MRTARAGYFGGCLGLLALVGLSLPAAAEAEAAPGGDDDGELAPTAVRVRLAGSVAVLTARFAIPIDGPELGIAVPIAIPVLGAITRATVTAGGVAHRLELVAAEDAQRRFEALTDRPAGARPRGGMLITSTNGFVHAMIAAPRAGTIALELEVHVPACFWRDTRYVVVPPAWKRRGDAAMRARRAGPDDLACGLGDAEDAWVALPSPALARRAPGGDRVGVTAGRLALRDTHLAHVELALAGALSEAPRDLATVLVVDASRSMTRAQLDAQRALVAAYVRAAPPASYVQVVAFARRAHPLLAGWTAAAHAGPRVERALLALAPANGSNVDAGLVEAGRWLARLPGTPRVVVLGDERLATRLTKEVLVALPRRLPARTLVHAVAIGDEVPGHDVERERPERDDDTALAPLAAATAGLAARTTSGTRFDATVLVRPISLDRVAVRAPGWTAIDAEHGACEGLVDASLGEGEACAWWGRGRPSTGPIVVEGYLWGRRVTRVVRPDPARGIELARALTATGTLDHEADLADEIALAARAVNRMWSLYGEWGGPHAHPDALFGIGATCCGPSGHGTIFGVGSGGTFTGRPRLDLAPQLAGRVARCGLGAHRVVADVETTRSEIVDVRVRVLAPVAPAEARRLEACVADAIWDTAITVPAHIAHATSQVAF